MPSLDMACCLQLSWVWPPDHSLYMMSTIPEDLMALASMHLVSPDLVHRISQLYLCQPENLETLEALKVLKALYKPFIPTLSAQ